jgi:hypothetical protein
MIAALALAAVLIVWASLRAISMLVRGVVVLAFLPYCLRRL